MLDLKLKMYAGEFQAPFQYFENPLAVLSHDSMLVAFQCRDKALLARHAHLGIGNVALRDCDR
jgi:hypothetical protein